jgi:FG-GAP repeat
MALPLLVACSEHLPGEPEVAARHVAVVEQRWIEMLAPEPRIDDTFGSAVALDEEQALVGIPGRDSAADAADDGGAAQLFHYRSGGWEAGQELVAIEPLARAGLGASVALHGATAIIANGDASVATATEFHESAGLVYAFRQVDEKWRAQQLIDPALGTDRRFGAALAALDDQVIVGAPGWDLQGAAYVYEWSATDGWTRTQELTPPADATTTGFGWSIAADETTLLISAVGDAYDDSGFVVVYERGPARDWQYRQTLHSHTPLPGDGFGYSVSLYRDQVLIGASGNFLAEPTESTPPDTPMPIAPVAYLLQRTDVDWAVQPTHEFRPNDLLGPDDQFATSVQLGDGWLWIAAPQQIAGVVYPFELRDNEWQAREALSPAVAVGRGFGTSLSASGRTLLLGYGADLQRSGSAFWVTQPQGSPCGGPLDCASGYCVDGVCCEADCDAPCFSCSAKDKVSGVDGECGPTSSTVLPPAGECSPETPPSCGRTGHCDGAGQCALHPPTTLCAPSMCIDAVALRPARYCDGLGECGAVATASCGELSCVDGACETCVRDENCQLQQFCGARGCEDKRVAAEPCGRQAECESGWCPAGHCVDGPECGDDGTFVVATNGEREDCVPYACAGGECRSRCSKSSHCSPGFACGDDGRCLSTAPPDLSRQAGASQGSACTFAPSPGAFPGAWLLLASVAVTTSWMRRRRAAQLVGATHPRRGRMTRRDCVSHRERES